MSEAPVALAPEEPLVAPSKVEAPVVHEVPAAGGEPAQTTESAPAPEKPAEPEKPTTEQPEKAGKNRYQRRLDTATRKFYEEKARADFLETQLKSQQPKTPVDGEPRLEQFSDIEEYAKAKGKFEREQGIKEYVANQQAQTAKQAQDRLVSEWAKKADAGMEKYNDFEEVVGNLTPTTPWAAAIMQAENAEEVAYYLGTHLAEAQAIIALDPFSQIRAIGRLEAKLMSEPAKPKTPSQAPAPIAPVGGKSGGASDIPLDTDDINTWMRKSRALDKKRREAGA